MAGQFASTAVSAERPTRSRYSWIPDVIRTYLDRQPRGILPVVAARVSGFAGELSLCEAAGHLANQGRLSSSSILLARRERAFQVLEADDTRLREAICHLDGVNRNTADPDDYGVSSLMVCERLEQRAIHLASKRQRADLTPIMADACSRGALTRDTSHRVSQGRPAPPAAVVAQGLRQTATSIGIRIFMASARSTPVERATSISVDRLETGACTHPVLALPRRSRRNG